MERLKSSLKSLHGAITDVKPTVPTFFHLHGNDSPTTSSNPSLVDQSYLTMPSSSSSSRTIRAVDDDIESFALGKVSSKRFFFSPLTTNSIMEEAKLKAANGEYSRRCSFCDGCTTVAIASRDPYRDFRASMEEMVAAHGLREWPRLEELLHCYLRLNEEKHHRVIVLAFAYLLLQF
ncbi:transcription repressor OFP13-like [Curcuma longa]|uniref:transcription repressor OFP13-like n=1 Tax=Curcuma longa TaxID=136217 RepID=UPI003D9EDE85